jgi:CTP:molybdopterin cytidylyltransferase MocA
LPSPPPSSLVVVLAAGRSSRAGQPKGLIVVEGRPWIDRQLEALAGALPGRRVVLVLGHDRDRYLPVVMGLGRPVDLVTNPDPDRGPFSSLQEGLAAADPGQPVFVLPVDVPAASKAVWQALEAALAQPNAPGEAALAQPNAPGEAALAQPNAPGEAALEGPLEAAVPVHAGRGGHPVLLGPGLVARLLERPATSRLDEELRALPQGRIARVPVDDARVGLNLNTAGDWGKVAEGG